MTGRLTCGGGPRAGSTLLELTIVLAVFAILLTVVVPGLTAVPAAPAPTERDSLRAAAVQAGAVLRSARFVAFPDGRIIEREVVRAE
jgi:Tfp pilus assembly protein FimT